MGSRSPSPALLGSFSRLSALVELKGDIWDLSWNISPGLSHWLQSLFPAGAGSPLRGRSSLAVAMASSASSWMAETERRLQDCRNPDIDVSGIGRWRQAAEAIRVLPKGLTRSQVALTSIRKDLGSKKLQFDPQRWTFVVEGRPVQVHDAYRLLQGSGGTLVGSRSPSPALLGPFSRLSAQCSS